MTMGVVFMTMPLPDAATIGGLTGAPALSWASLCGLGLCRGRGACGGIGTSFGEWTMSRSTFASIGARVRGRDGEQPGAGDRFESGDLWGIGW